MMALRLNCLATLLSLSLFGTSQSWTFVQSYEIPQRITSMDVGVLDKVYVGTERGNVYSFLADGTPDTELSSAIFQPVTAIDASNTLRVFVYYKDIYTFEYLERFSAFPRKYSLADFGLISGQYAITGLNNTIWVLDGNELIQLNPFNRSVLTRKKLNCPIEGTVGLYIGQSIVIADSNGIKDISHEGTLINELEAKGINHISTDGTLVMAVSGDQLIIWNRITTMTESIKIPGNYSMCVRAGDYYHFVKDSTVFTYQLQE